MALNCVELRSTDVNCTQMSSKIEHLGVNSEVRYKWSFISFLKITLTSNHHCMTDHSHSQTERFSAVDRSSRRHTLPAVLIEMLVQSTPGRHLVYNGEPGEEESRRNGGPVDWGKTIGGLAPPMQPGAKTLKFAHGSKL